MARDLGITALIALACFGMAIPLTIAVLWAFGALGLGYVVPARVS